MPEQLAIFKSLQHPTRLEILEYLKEHPQDVIYSDLLSFCDDSTGKLNYHLRTLDDLVVKTEVGYNLSEKGNRVANWLNSYEKLDDIEEEFSRPDIVINKIFPSKALLYKYILQSLLIFFPFLVGSVLFWVFLESIIPLVLVVISYALTLISLWLFFNSIWYRITETEIEVFKGFITHTHKIVPFRTVTNVESKVGPFDRIFGIGTVDVHTAGNSGQQGAEEHIVGMVEGDEIRETIIERIRLLNPISSIISARKKKPNNLPQLAAIKDELVHLNLELNK